jgi:hypothetical protein
MAHPPGSAAILPLDLIPDSSPSPLIISVDSSSLTANSSPNFLLRRAAKADKIAQTLAAIAAIRTQGINGSSSGSTPVNSGENNEGESSAGGFGGIETLSAANYSTISTAQSSYRFLENDEINGAETPSELSDGQNSPQIPAKALKKADFAFKSQESREACLEAQQQKRLASAVASPKRHIKLNNEILVKMRAERINCHEAAPAVEQYSPISISHSRKNTRFPSSADFSDTESSNSSSPSSRTYINNVSLRKKAPNSRGKPQNSTETNHFFNSAPNSGAPSSENSPLLTENHRNLAPHPAELNNSRCNPRAGRRSSDSNNHFCSNQDNFGQKSLSVSSRARTILLSDFPSSNGPNWGSKPHNSGSVQQNPASLVQLFKDSLVNLHNSRCSSPNDSANHGQSQGMPNNTGNQRDFALPPAALRMKQSILRNNTLNNLQSLANNHSNNNGLNFSPQSYNRTQQQGSNSNGNNNAAALSVLQLSAVSPLARARTMQPNSLIN